MSRLRRTRRQVAFGAACSLLERLPLTVALVRTTTKFKMGLWGDDVGSAGEGKGRAVGLGC